MNQPGLVIGSQDAAISYVQPPTVIAASYPKMKSCPLIGFGVVLFLLSGSSVGVSAWIMHITNCGAFADLSLGCGLIFLVLSLFAMYGGNDVGRRQYCIIWAMVLGIVGFITAGVAVIVCIVDFEKYVRECIECRNLPITEPPPPPPPQQPMTGYGLAREPNYGISYEWHHFSVPSSSQCADECSFGFDYVKRGPVYVAFAAVAALEGLTALILSIAACCSACSCCFCYKNYHPHGYVIQSSGNQFSFNQNSQVPYRTLTPSLEC